jgi:hypothetical protein
MPGFLARVELHAGEQDYGMLHKEMGAKGFQNGLMLVDTDYQLPTGTYFESRDDLTLATATSWVVDAATRAGYPPDRNQTKGSKGTPGTSAIVVFQTDTGRQAGLKKS